MTDLLGYTATILVNISLLPQVIKCWKTSQTSDLSKWWIVQFNIGLVMWLVYGIAIRNNPLIYGTSFELVLSLFVLVAKLKFK